MRTDERKLKLEKASRMAAEGLCHGAGLLYAQLGRKKDARKMALLCFDEGNYVSSAEVLREIKDKDQVLEFAKKLEGNKIKQYHDAGVLYLMIRKRKDAKRLAIKCLESSMLEDALDLFKRLKNSYQVNKIKKLIRQKKIEEQRLKV